MLHDSLADIFLSFSQFNVLFIIALAGFLLINRPLFFQTACLTAFDIVVNVALKGTFKVPLAAWLGKGYAFPSGHMQLSTVFYLWLAWHTPRLSLRLLVAGILSAIGAGLIHYGYHNFYDVLGGLLFGGILVSLYWYISLKYAVYMPWILALAATLLMVYNGLQYTPIPRYCWVGYYCLLGLITAERIILRDEHKYYWRLVVWR
ncbi:PAP2 superfamily protein [Legionella birminghamensis]|uniref:PAP2 superfamily n=1 Tax=Legionella birminghamensis TaxID=28083 RepID=A0A378I619_9GAMM|nr:phosphatase PAP2 family protein [Legionella birminghamensis]KTC72477.1 PAP2 superfamily protein [Legionella birminghamensis]STX30609.1 PAP2 superfamily [Legionella birminghamensis]